MLDNSINDISDNDQLFYLQKLFQGHHKFYK